MTANGVTVDEILPYVGEFGKFQIMQETFLCLILVCVTFSHYIGYFATLDSPWECVTNSTICLSNGTMATAAAHYDDRCNMSHQHWQYEQPKGFSLVTQFDLHCDRKWISQMVLSSFYLGWFFGGSIVGGLADRYGRKTILLICTSWRILGNFLSAFSPNIWFFICVRFLLGCSVPGGSLQAFILLSEMVGPRYRPMTSSIYWQFWNVSNSILTLTAFLVQDWKLMFILCSAPYAFILAFFPFLPESVRWLRTHRGSVEAMQVIRRVAKFNGKVIPEEIRLQEVEKCQTNTETSLLDLFKTKQRVAKIFNLSYAWMAVNMLYHGLAMASGDFGGSPYMNFLLISLIEIPAMILYGFAVNLIGRKMTTVYSCFLASLACLCFIFIPIKQEWKVLRLTLGVLGKLFASIEYTTMFLWSTELYPTTIRATATSFMQAMAPLGGFAAPWISGYLKELHPSSPFATFGGIALLSAICLLRLPETKDQPTAELTSD